MVNSEFGSGAKARPGKLGTTNGGFKLVGVDPDVESYDPLARLIIEVTKLEVLHSLLLLAIVYGQGPVPTDDVHLMNEFASKLKKFRKTIERNDGITQEDHLGLLAEIERVDTFARRVDHLWKHAKHLALPMIEPLNRESAPKNAG